MLLRALSEICRGEPNRKMMNPILVLVGIKLERNTKMIHSLDSFLRKRPYIPSYHKCRRSHA